MLRKTAGTFVVKVTVAIINLLIAIFLSHTLGAQGKGEASLVIAGIAMLMLFCNMIGGASLIYLVPRYNIFKLAVISNLWSVVVCCIAYIVLSLTSLVSPQFTLHVCLLTLINSFLSTNLSILVGKERIAGNNVVMLLQAIINLVILVVLVSSLGRTNLQSYIVSLYAALLTCFAISTVLITRFLRDRSFTGYGKMISELAHFGFTNQLGHVMSFISFRISYFLLSKHVGDAGVGVYSNGTSLIESILLITNSIAMVQYSTIANTDDKKYSQQLTVQLVRVSILLCIVTLIPLLLLPGSFFVWLFGTEFRGVRTVIFLLAPGILFYNVTLIIGHYFSGVGKYMVNTIWNLMGLIVTIVISSLFMYLYSIRVAALITSASYIVTTITVLIYFLRETNINILQLLPRISDVKAARDKVSAIVKR